MRRLITSHALAGTAVALPWPALLAAVWQTTDDPTLLGLAGAARFAPCVLLSAFLGGIGDRFFAGDATLTRAAIRLADGTLGYSWIVGRDRPHAERCAAIDALLQSPRHFHNLMETLITPLEALRSARIEARRAEVNASRVDFFTLVRGDNA